MNDKVGSRAEHRAAEARRDNFAQRTAPDEQRLAVERAIERIERDLGRLDLVHRIAVEASLWQMVAELPHRMRREPWE